MRQRPGDCCANGTGLPPRPMTATTVTRGHPIKLCCECRVYQSNEWDAVLLPSEEHQALRFWRTEVLVCRRHVLNEIRRQVLHPPATCLHDRSRLSKASDPNLAAQTIRGMLDEHARWVKCVCDSEVSPGTRCLSCCASRLYVGHSLLECSKQSPVDAGSHARELLPKSTAERTALDVRGT